MSEKQQLIDRFTRQDELLDQIATLLQDIRDKESDANAEVFTLLQDIRDKESDANAEVFTLSYPYDATYLTIAAGTTIYDFEHGTVSSPGAAVVKMSTSLAAQRKDFMRSLVIDSNKDTILQLDEQDKMIVHAGRWLFPHKQFRKARITTTENTDMFIVASTHPSTLDVAGESVIQGNDSGTLRTVAVDGSGNMVTLMKGDDGTNLQTIKVDATGQMYVAMTGQSLNVDNHPSDYFKADESAVVKGDDGGTKRLIAVDTSGIMLSRMKGAYGAVLKDILLDDTGIMLSRMKGSYGGALKDIEVDTDGNMISVMKGDYEGVLKTWKVDTDGRGEMFINDPSDVWGNINPMGLGEHAVRTHAPPLVFDKRGNIIRWIDFESATENFDVVTGGSATYSRTDSTAATGDFSGKMSVDNTEYVYIRSVTNDFHIGRLGHQALFATADSDLELQLWLTYYDGSSLHAGILQYDFSNGLLKYLDENDVFQTIATLDHYKTVHNFSTIKLVVDFNTDTYIRALVFGNEYDLSSYSLRDELDNGTKRVQLFTKITGTAAGINTVYIDNIILTENEPGN